MRWLAAIALLALAGCATTRREEAPPPTPAERVSDKTDLVQSRAAAAVSVARVANQNGQPKVVEAELSVAAQYLPRPTPSDLEFAQKRAGKADQSAYAQAREIADKHQRELTQLRQDAAAQVAAAKAEGQARLDTLKAEHEAGRQRLVTIALLAIGGGGIAAGIAGLWLGFSKANASASILVGGAVVASVRFFDSPWFGWVAVPAMGAFAFEAVRRLRETR